VPEFESNLIPFEEISPNAATRSINGPSVACIGWIPFYLDLSEMPECDFKHHRIAQPALFHPSGASLLFLAGNMSESGSASDPSPASFSGRTQFLSLLESKNFRAALALDEVELIVDEMGKPLRIAFKSLDEVGYTPMRVAMGRRFLTYHDRGRGSSDFEIITDSDAVTIRIWIRFKIGKLGDLGGFFFTHRRAASASMSVEYRIDSLGRTSVRVWGSFIPSQSLYIDWARETLHDMIGNSESAIDGFLNAGSCCDAPGRFWGDRVHV
jgi:hypothetical protein